MDLSWMMTYVNLVFITDVKDKDILRLVDERNENNFQYNLVDGLLLYTAYG